MVTGKIRLNRRHFTIFSDFEFCLQKHNIYRLSKAFTRIFSKVKNLFCFLLSRWTKTTCDSAQLIGWKSADVMVVVER